MIFERCTVGRLDCDMNDAKRAKLHLQLGFVRVPKRFLRSYDVSDQLFQLFDVGEARSVGISSVPDYAVVDGDAKGTRFR